MNDISYSLNIDVTSQLLSYDVYVASKNDTNIRYLNIALFENGNAVPLSENATATASFVTNNVLIDEDIACTIDGNIITVPLTDLQQQVTVTDGNKTLATPYPIQVKVTPNIAETAQIDENSMGSYAEVVQEIATARDGYNNLDERLDSMASESASTYEQLANKSQTINPTQQSGDDVKYPSVNAARNYTNSRVANLRNYVNGLVDSLDFEKADKTDVYTKTQVYNTAEANNRFADASTTYTKTETDLNISQAAARKESLSHKVQSISENAGAGDNDNYPSVNAARTYTNSKNQELKDYADGKFEAKTNKVTEITDGSTANQYPTVAAVKNYVDGEVNTLDSAKADKSEVYTKTAADEKFEVNTNKASTIYPDPREGENNYYPSVTAVRNYTALRYSDMSDYVDGELDSLYDTIQEGLNGKEDKINKVSEITDGSTANQYPTVAAVKNYRNELLDKSRKNLIAFPNVTIDNNGVHYSINNNRITVSGTADTTSNAYGIIDFETPIELEAGTYMASIRDEENPPSNVMIYFYIQGISSIAFQVNGSTTKKKKFEPTETVFIRRVIIGVGAGKDASTAQTKTTAFHLQLEKGEEATDYEPPVDTYKIKNNLIPDNIPDKAYVKKAVNNMNYIYVSNDYDESTEGFGKIYFNSIIAANDSITDNSKENPYTIIVKSGTTAEPCVYDEFEELYGGTTDTSSLQGIRTKNYVYYESETPDNPSACKLKWDGVEGYLKWDGEEVYKEGELTNEVATKKCIFHLVNDVNNPGGGMHTHIKGFTMQSKNTRYGIHMESGGYGRNREWLVENCVIEYGGRPDVYKGSVNPVIGMGMSPHEIGTIRKVKAFFSDGYTAGTRALNCHDNYETTVYTNIPAVKAGAKLTIDNCDFSGYVMGLSKGNTQRTDPVSDTPFNAYLINNANISETVVSSGNWQAKGESVLVSGE